MCFNRFFRVSKQLNGMWHQLHFFSCTSGGGGGGGVSTSSPNEIGDDIGVVSMILEGSWKAWVWRLALFSWFLFSFLRSSFALAARKVCLITSIFKDLFSRLRKKHEKICIVFCNPWMNCGFGEKNRIAHRRSLFFCKSSEFLIFFFGNFVRHTFSSQELSVHSTFWKNLPDQNKRGIFLLFEKSQVNTKAEPLYSRHSISSTKTLHSLWLQRTDSPQDILCSSTPPQVWTKKGCSEETV